MIVYRNPDGLTKADQKLITENIDALNEDVKGVSEPFRLGDQSTDGTAAIVLSSITATGQGGDLLDPVDQIREEVSGDHAGMEVAVTGPAGYSADAIKVYE